MVPHQYFERQVDDSILFESLSPGAKAIYVFVFESESVYKIIIDGKATNAIKLLSELAFGATS